MGDIVVLWDFKVWTKGEQTTMFGTTEASYGEVIEEYCFLKQRTKDMAEVTEYGKDFSSLGESTWIYDIMICSIDPY